MARCEDFPCCGHEAGCCPNFNESGEQLDMVCTCGKRLPITNRYSICNQCLQDDCEYDHEEYDDCNSGYGYEEMDGMKNDIINC